MSALPGTALAAADRRQPLPLSRVRANALRDQASDGDPPQRQELAILRRNLTSQSRAGHLSDQDHVRQLNDGQD